MKSLKRRFSLSLRRSRSSLVDDSISELTEQMTVTDNGGCKISLFVLYLYCQNLLHLKKIAVELLILSSFNPDDSNHLF